MAFVVEDGTGIANANSYASVTEADSYFSDRGFTTWTGTNAEKQGWLIQATDYIDSRFYARFKGSVEFPDTPQALQFPRIGITGFTGIPLTLKRAAFEYALRAKASPLAPDIKMDASGLIVSETYKKVGPIETQTKFATGLNGTNKVSMLFKPYPAADLLLRPLLTSNNSVIRT